MAIQRFLRQRRLVFGVALCCIAGITGLWLSSISGNVRLRMAQERWVQHGPEHYRLVAAFSPTCMIDVDVTHQQVSTYHRWDPCMHPARTADDLFRLVENSVERDTCSLSGCACRVNITVQASYHATYGYPERVTMRLVRTPNLFSTNFWADMLRWRRVPSCFRFTETELARVIALTPLP